MASNSCSVNNFFFVAIKHQNRTVLRFGIISLVTTYTRYVKGYSFLSAVITAKNYWEHFIQEKHDICLLFSILSTKYHKDVILPSYGASTRQVSKPVIMALSGRLRPMNTILLIGRSPSAHFGPKSAATNMCTPCVIIL